jgi:hypothetical protein
MTGGRVFPLSRVINSVCNSRHSRCPQLVTPMKIGVQKPSGMVLPRGLWTPIFIGVTNIEYHVLPVSSRLTRGHWLGWTRPLFSSHPQRACIAQRPSPWRVVPGTMADFWPLAQAKCLTFEAATP